MTSGVLYMVQELKIHLQKYSSLIVYVMVSYGMKIDSTFILGKFENYSVRIVEGE